MCTATRRACTPTRRVCTAACGQPNARSVDREHHPCDDADPPRPGLRAARRRPLHVRRGPRGRRRATRPARAPGERRAASPAPWGVRRRRAARHPAAPRAGDQARRAGGLRGHRRERGLAGRGADDPAARLAPGGAAAEGVRDGPARPAAQGAGRQRHPAAAPRDVMEVHGVRVTTPLRTFLDLGRLPTATRDRRDVPAAALDVFAHEEVYPESSVQGHARCRPAATAHAPGRPALRVASRGNAGLRFHQGGLPTPVPEVDLFDEDGRFLGRGDLVVPT